MFRLPIHQAQHLFVRSPKSFIPILKLSLPVVVALRKMSTDDQPRPTGPVAKEGIECLTFGTPNGHKATILLEELKEAYGIDYTWQAINIMDNIQKEEWFLKYSPNGRIPAIIDHDNSGFSVFEGAGRSFFSIMTSPSR